MSYVRPRRREPIIAAQQPPVPLTPSFSMEELQLAARNHGMPLEALRHPVTPTGLHYLLTHFDIPVVEPSEWALSIGGQVEREMSLSLDEIRRRPRVTSPVTFECAGNGRARMDPRPISQPWLDEAVGTGEWTGTPLSALLREAELSADAVEIVFTGLDRGIDGGVEQAYQRSLFVQEALRDDVLLAYELNGRPLPPQHGFPLRLIVPGWYGMTNVKWLRRIEAVGEPFQGFQQQQAYRMRTTDTEAGTPLSRMMPRALMVPPGDPEFLSRRRHVPLGPVPLAGRAWSGWGVVTGVEVSTDGGLTWRPGRLDHQPAVAAWRGWSFDWTPPGPGDYELRCRATDAEGNTQPDEPPWNLGGYSNNAVQRVPVTVQPG
jgi:DMSO/TMAO reductase YedYZ molybdopterin-dependent catalytic subunit